MAKVRYSRLARKDLLDLWQHIELQTSEAAADAICDRIENACQVLTEYPQLGRARPEIADGARSLVVERWLALYRLVPGGVQIVRIVDGARDLTKIEWALQE